MKQRPFPPLYGGRVTQNDVLIIGAGPSSGLFAAAELSRHGVQARLTVAKM
jgi:cation diffusion facilitator CzcD-associated flavoprotein CzcO